MRRALLCLSLVAALLVGSPADPVEARGPATPALDVEVVESNLDHPWGLTFAPDGTMYFTERSGGWFSLAPPYTATPTPVTYNDADLFVNGETGLLDIEVDPNFAENRRIFTCQGIQPEGQRARIQVISWRMFTGNAQVRKIRVLVNDVTIYNPSQVGRHGGCRLEFGNTGALYVGTGDGARAENPQSLIRLGGKILRVDPDTGAGLSTNPWGDAANPNRRRIWNYGHRNVQGLALRPGTGQLYSVEHGSFRDDELNSVRKGRNYGWGPLGPGYDESPPMTDTERFPNAVPAVWSSGPSTIATSGADFLEGDAWGAWEGALAVGVLKDTRLLIYRLSASGTLLGVDTPAALLNTFGRLRTPVMGPDGFLYVTTDTAPYRILRVCPGTCP